MSRGGRSACFDVLHGAVHIGRRAFRRRHHWWTRAMPPHIELG